MDIGFLRSEFCSDITESKFLTHHLAQTQAQLRVTLALCSVFYMAFVVTDIAVLGYGRNAFILLMGRMAVAVTAAFCSLLTYRQRQSVAATRLAASLVEVVGMSVFMLIVAFRPDELPWHAMSMALMLVAVYLFIPNRLGYSLAIALSATGAFLVLAFTLGTLKPSDMLTMSMLLLLANTFGCFAARRHDRLWREEFRAQMNLKDLSVHDHLTGCFNRRFLHEKLLESELSRARRYGLCLTVIMCDLDHFKCINDSYGHHGGDAVLRTFSDLLQKMTRKNIDSVVRYGGEEFLLILPETNLHDGTQLAERLRIAFAAVATVSETHNDIHTTASFGVATVDFACSSEKVTLDGVIAAADGLLYEAKNGGRNLVKSIQLA
ncbi:phytochrome-like protein cph2 [mine drainage metagenome]|uniref:Phytochrome-like protein cph2 n=1 Tax=mine drainage metagenome TaxID=410659 RepID=A0A1J5Q3M4_9ZZZZ